MKLGIASSLLANGALVVAAYSFDPLQHLAGIAPYFEPEDPPLDPSPPQGCNITRAAYLVRHAAIYANDFDYESYIEPFIEKLTNSSADWSKSKDLSFLSTWKSPVSDSEQEKITKVGQLEAFRLGVEVQERYLIGIGGTFKQPQKVWASTSERTTMTAKSFIEGLQKFENATSLISVSEGEEEGANSLTPHESCPAYSSSRGSSQQKEFVQKYTKPIIARLQSQASSFNFTSSDIIAMQELCGYETVIRGSSPFCSLSLFTPNDWLAFEYANDIQYHHNTGYGNEVSGVMGFPWVNATASLLLAENADQDLYVSFTHRELPPTVLVALGLFNNSAYTGSNNPNTTMPTDEINYNRVWQSSRIIPFLTNIAIERMYCQSFGFDEGTYLRVVVNKSPQSLLGCSDGPGQSCSESGFKQIIQKGGDEFGDFSTKCGVGYQNSTNELAIYS